MKLRSTTFCANKIFKKIFNVEKIYFPLSASPFNSIVNTFLISLINSNQFSLPTSIKHMSRKSAKLNQKDTETTLKVTKVKISSKNS